jgi:hypothetical protein
MVAFSLPRRKIFGTSFRLIPADGLYGRRFGQAFEISPDMKNSKHVTGDSIADDRREEHRRRAL